MWRLLPHLPTVSTQSWRRNPVLVKGSLHQGKSMTRGIWRTPTAKYASKQVPWAMQWIRVESRMLLPLVSSRSQAWQIEDIGPKCLSKLAPKLLLALIDIAYSYPRVLCEVVTGPNNVELQRTIVGKDRWICTSVGNDCRGQKKGWLAQISERCRILSW